jgi:hypothetical protein
MTTSRATSIIHCVLWLFRQPCVSWIRRGEIAQQFRVYKATHQILCHILASEFISNGWVGEYRPWLLFPNRWQMRHVVTIPRPERWFFMMFVTSYTRHQRLDGWLKNRKTAGMNLRGDGKTGIIWFVSGEHAVLIVPVLANKYRMWRPSHSTSIPSKEKVAILMWSDYIKEVRDNQNLWASVNRLRYRVSFSEGFVLRLTLSGISLVCSTRFSRWPRKILSI